MKSERVFQFMFCLAVVAQVTFVIAVVSIACKRMNDAMVSFEAARATMMKFAVLIAAQQDAPAGATGPTGGSP
jgi:dethiobiotin synthetase